MPTNWRGLTPLAKRLSNVVAPVAKAAARKAASDPGAAVLIGVVALVVVSTMVKKAAGLPGEVLGDLGGALGAGWDRFREFGEVDIPEFTDRALEYPAELTDKAVAAAWDQSRSVVTGFWQGELNEDDPGPEYYTKTYYDDSGVPIAVPVEINRTAKGIGRGIRRAIGDWSIPGF